MDAAGWVPLFISITALIVTGITAWATWIAPRNAAALAENLRAASEKAGRTEAMKNYVFLTLMQERNAPYTSEAVKAFNVIDVVFRSNTPIRQAWAFYLDAQDPKKEIPQHAKDERLSRLLELMAIDVGFENINITDISRFYAPIYLMRKLKIEILQQDIHERELDALVASQSANLNASASK